MWDLAVREGRYALSDSLFRQKFGAATPLGHRAMLALVRHDSSSLVRLLDDAGKSDYEKSVFAAQWISLYLHDFATAERFARLGLESGRPVVRDSSRRQLAWLALAQGRWATARQRFAAVEGGAAGTGQLRALSATLPFLLVPRDDIEAILTDIERWDPRGEPAGVGLEPATILGPHLRLYLLGLLSSRLGREAEALEHAGSLDKLAAPGEFMPLVRDLAGTVRADVAWRRHQMAEALRILDSIQGEIPFDLLSAPFFSLPFFSEEHARYLRAEVLYALGRDREALRWWETAFVGTPAELVYLAPSHLRQAQLYERLGDREKAAAHYGQFIRLWKECDPGLRHLVDEARARLTQLVGEPSARPGPDRPRRTPSH
jgi:tetratricopeptide (TPR) repeat protein